jgi:hypothetical protein
LTYFTGRLLCKPRFYNNAMFFKKSNKKKTMEDIPWSVFGGGAGT